MYKRILAIVLAVIFLSGSLGLALAASGKGNSRKGKYLYRKNCRTCHSQKGNAKDLSPLSMTQAQWKTTFASKDKLACADKWTKLKDKDVTDIYAYLWGHAKDSPSPAKCK